VYSVNDYCGLKDWSFKGRTTPTTMGCGFFDNVLHFHFNCVKVNTSANNERQHHCLACLAIVGTEYSLYKIFEVCKTSKVLTTG